MATRVLAYECQYCGALKKTKRTCERHEISCLKNPNARNCILCTHSIKEEGETICAKTGKRCSVAVSANCNQFTARYSAEHG